MPVSEANGHVQSKDPFKTRPLQRLRDPTYSGLTATHFFPA